MKICPRCNREYDGYPALSRRDNKTDICDACGTEEALIDAGYMEETENEIRFLEKINREKNVASEQSQSY